MEYSYVGTYTSTKRNGLGYGGIHVFCRNPSDLQWTQIQVYEIENPSYLAFGKDKNTLYTVRADGNIITAFSVDPKTGMLSYLNEKNIAFNNGVSLVTDQESRFLFVASASIEPGAFVSIRLEKDGSLGELCGVTIFQGETGPLRPAQLCSQPHQVCYDSQGKFLIEPDRGLDEINTIEVDYETGSMKKVHSLKLPASCCPRHVSFHPSKNYAYILTEWIGRIVVCHYENGIFTPIEIIDTTPSSFLGLKNLAAEIQIHPSGKYVYASNRGHDSIAAFRIKKDGRLESIGWYTEGVSKPRYFTLSEDGCALFCANESGHTVTCYSISEQTGELSFRGVIMDVHAPACILFKETVAK